MTIVVVGAGISGLSCARALQDAGRPVRVIERAAEVGGRLASVRRDGRIVDVGAAYLTADEPAFAGLVQSWRIAGLIRPWTETFRGQHGIGPTRWAAPGGLRSLAEDLARGLDLTLDTEVRTLNDLGMGEAVTGGAVVLAMPGPQARRIAGLGEVPRQSWAGVITAILRYAERSWPEFAGAFVNDDPALATVCDDGDRRGDGAPVLVAHSTPGFAADPPSDPGAALAAAVSRALDVPAPASVETITWPYAQPDASAGGFARVGDVYLCGDAFGRPRVQTAWLSGRAVAHDILARTP